MSIIYLVFLFTNIYFLFPVQYLNFLYINLRSKWVIASQHHDAKILKSLILIKDWVFDLLIIIFLNLNKIKQIKYKNASLT